MDFNKVLNLLSEDNPIHSDQALKLGDQLSDYNLASATENATAIQALATKLKIDNMQDFLAHFDKDADAICDALKPFLKKKKISEKIENKKKEKGCDYCYRKLGPKPYKDNFCDEECYENFKREQQNV